MSPKSGNIFILSGDFESGKTTLCLKLHDRLKESRLGIRGVICPPFYENEIKTGIEIMNVATGERRRLASLNQGSTQGVFTQHWIFNENALKWGDEILREAMPCDILFMDELGPLELERGEGWQSGLNAIDQKRYNFALVVIRPSLVNAAHARWQDSRVYFVTRKNQSEVLEILISQITESITDKNPKI